MYSQKRNDVTYIEDLPTLEDLEGSDNGPSERFQTPGSVPEKFKKFIRSAHSPPSAAGMESFTPPHPEQFAQVPQMGRMTQSGPMASDEFNKMPMEYAKMLAHTPSCLQIHDHVIACPICNKFYKNDTSVYIIAIVVLSIICIVLLKKVLDL